MIEDMIRKAYSEITPGPREWVKLIDLREQLGDVNRHKVDAALVSMPDVDAKPEQNQKILTGMDRDLAVWCGGQDCHLVRII